MDKAVEDKIIAVLTEAGCKEFYLFGSQVTGNTTENSDIDIGVFGLAPCNFFAVHSKLEDVTNYSVDLIDFDEKPKFFTLLKNLGELRRIG